MIKENEQRIKENAKFMSKSRRYIANQKRIINTYGWKIAKLRKNDPLQDDEIKLLKQSNIEVSSN